MVSHSEYTKDSLFTSKAPLNLNNRGQWMLAQKPLSTTKSPEQRLLQCLCTVCTIGSDAGIKADTQFSLTPYKPQLQTKLRRGSWCIFYECYKQYIYVYTHTHIQIKMSSLVRLKEAHFLLQSPNQQEFHKHCNRK